LNAESSFLSFSPTFRTDSLGTWNRPKEPNIELGQKPELENTGQNHGRWVHKKTTYFHEKVVTLVP
jgi:hypothetical protein